MIKLFICVGRRWDGRNADDNMNVIKIKYYMCIYTFVHFIVNVSKIGRWWGPSAYVALTVCVTDYWSG